MISSLGSSSALSQWASSLFSKLDTKNQGYIEKSDLQSALDGVSGSTSSSGSASVDDVFGALDTNGDGRVTEQEMSTSLQSLVDDLQNQLASSRMGAAGGMPPPPPPKDDSADQGFTKDELTSMAQEIGATDSKRSSLMSSIAANFDTADTNGDGRVNREEAMAFEQTLQSASSTSDTSTSTAATSTTSSTSSSQNTEALVMMRIMQLMRAYGTSSQDGSQSLVSGSLFAQA